MIASDLLVQLTPVTFGGPSSELKKALDRLLGVMMPYFEASQGSTRHKSRYRQYPSLLGVGVAMEPDAEMEQIFAALIRRNAVEMHCPRQAAMVLRADEQPESARSKIRDALSRVEVRR